MTAPAGWLEELSELAEPGERERFLREQTLPQDAQAQIHGAVLRLMYLDLDKAARLVAAGSFLASLHGDAGGRALAARSEGHLAHLRGAYSEATALYDAAAGLFENVGMEVELGRTLSSGMQALIYQGKYAEAEEAAARAEKIFERHGDLLRLARLDSNVGNIYFRQDRAQEALARYERALEGLEQCGEPRDIVAAHSNLAVCSTNLGKFSEALRHYERAREYASEHGFAGLVARADYNIAYLYYLRGDYSEARRLYQVTRDQCAKTGDAYHAALCDLDEAELFLELNLTAEGAQMARSAAEKFAILRMPYEEGKALVSVAIAANQRGEAALADKALKRARRLFVAERNRVWPALVDQLRAVLAFHEKSYGRAQRLSASATRVLSAATIPGRAAHGQIMLARLWLQAGYADRARAYSREALERLGEDASPSVRFHAALLDGEIHELQGRWSDALRAFEKARAQLEDMRGRLDTEDLRISILADKLAVYESLVSLLLEWPGSGAGSPQREAFQCVQQAKSRSLADRLAMSWRPGGEESPRLAELRKDLNWLYRQIDLAALLDQASGSGERVRVLREQARVFEEELLEAIRVRAVTVEGNPDGDPIEAMQGALGEDEVLLEYYEARGVLYLFILSRRGLRAMRLGSYAPVRQSMKLLQFQLRKLHYRGTGRPGGEESGDAVQAHLEDLYQILIAPAAEEIRGYKHLILAPHRNLHRLPFAALHDGTAALIDRFGLSTTPSASVFARCRQRVRVTGGSAVVMAALDERAPQIATEAREVTRLLPGAKVFIGAEATLDALRRYGSGVPILHMAAHGVFRRDNPMFSSIQLADGRVSLIDLHEIDLEVELLTLSACNTGSSVPVGGDELVGLIRGCLAAGARSLLVTLWEIDDESAMEFMRHFYKKVVNGAGLAVAAGAAMRAVRERYPHPYYWAPFSLVGDPAPVGMGVSGKRKK